MKVPLAPSRGYLSAFICLATLTFTGYSHTLPISYLTVVPGESRIHLELTINPFELNFFPELDANKNGRLDSAEAASADRLLTKRILENLKLSAGGTVLAAESAGIAAEPTGHHLTIRAHFPVADPAATLAIDSRLTAITTASHLTEVTYGKEGERQLARLDAQAGTALFNRASTTTTSTMMDASKALEAEPIQTAKVATPPPEQASTAFFVVFGLALIPLIGVFVALLMFAPKHLREEPVHH